MPEVFKAWACALRKGLVLVGIALLVGCSVGQGQGEVYGEAFSEACGLDDLNYSLEPSFFSAQLVDDQLNIRVQRGSNSEAYSDGLLIHIGDVNEIREHRIGLPIPITSDYRGLVQVVLHMNESCPSGFPSNQRVTPFALQASAGAITFRSIYAPEFDVSTVGIEAELVGLEFEDPNDPGERRAILDGNFSFFYQRGAPAQRFP